MSRESLESPLPPRLPFLAPILVPAGVLVLSAFTGIGAASLVLPAAAGCVALVAFASIRPGLRRVRYEAALVGAWFLGLDALAGSADRRAAGALALLPLWLPALTVPLHRLVVSGAAAPGRAARRARLAYRLTHHGLGSLGSLLLMGLFLSGRPWAVVGAIALLFAFGTARYYAGAVLARSPILYLRAFSSKRVFASFKKLVAPAIAPRRVLIGLTPTKDRKALLGGPLALSSAWLHVVPDAQWRAWVERELSRATGAIFDLTDPTGNLLWELDRARALLPPGRIFLLRGPEPGQEPPPASVPGAAYDGTRATRRAARAGMRRWLCGVEEQA